MKRIISVVVILLVMTGCVNSKTEAPAPFEPSTPKTSLSEPVQEGKNGQAVPLYTAIVSTIEEQDLIDQELQMEAETGYSFEDPFVVVDPYGMAPLSALVIFDTDSDQAVTMTVKGHDFKDNIIASFEAEKRHLLPVAGLYAGQETDIELRLADGRTKTLSITTDPIDEDIVKAEVVQLDSDFYDYSQLTFACYNYGTLGYDSKGDLRYFSKYPALPLTQLSNGHYASYTCDFADQKSATFSGVVEFDLCGRIYNCYDLPGGAHHEILEMPNGNLLIGSSHDDLSTINCRVVEVERETGNIVWDVDMCDVLTVMDGEGVLYNSMNQAGFSVWFHNNSLAYDEATGSLLISGRLVDSVVCIDKSSKALKWILGTKEGWKGVNDSYFFTPVGDNFEWQFAQHNVSILPDMDKNPATIDVLLFDNGCSRIKTEGEVGVSGDNVYSRAVVYHLDTNAMTITQKWEYGKERGASWYSAYISGATYDEVADTYWLCSGGIQYDPLCDNYDLSVTSFNGDLKVQYSAFIDAVQNDTLKYELRVGKNVYRCVRMALYPNEGTSLDLTQAGRKFQIKGSA